MKLYDAKLCLDCDEIIPKEHEACVCSNTVLIPLSQWLQPLQDLEEINLVRFIGKAARS